MFTGLIQALGTVRDAKSVGTGRRFQIDISGLSGSPTIGQSIAINGVCLTIAQLDGKDASFDAIQETVSRSNLALLKNNDKVNLEPAIKIGDALDGHIVQGHVDAMGKVLSVHADSQYNRVIKISLPTEIRHLVAEKGSIAVDGISLTVAAAGPDWFTISIIPHSWDNSTLSLRRIGDPVNLEVDVLARYAARIMQYGPQEGLTLDLLKENGFA